MASDSFKVTIHMVSSVDGFIAKTDNSVGWFDTVDHYEKGISEQSTEASSEVADCYVMGYRTYEHAEELAKSYGWVYGDIPTIVITHRNLSVNRTNIETYSGDLNYLIHHQLKPKYKNVWMVGGAMLAKDFIRLKLANEIRITIIPIILGEGTLFFDHTETEQALHLKDVTPYKNGLVELCYEMIF